jgi:response regulator of citrate/malate metabolism
MTIVIIEDEKELGILVRNFLVKQFEKSPSGSNIKIATSLSEGMTDVKEMNPDWVFVDNNLPDGKGINQIEVIKNRHNSKPTCVVVMSAMTNLREEAFRKGADYFLDKPISFVEIDRILAKALSE